MLATPDKETGLNCLQSACIEGDVETVSTILNYSTDKLDSALALSLNVGHNGTTFAGKSINTILRRQDSEENKQIRDCVENVTKHFQSQSLLHLAAKIGHVEHLRMLINCGEYVSSLSPDLSDRIEKTPLMLAAKFNEEDVVEFLVERGASLEIQDVNGFTAIKYAAVGGKIRNILRLIELGADVSKGCGTPLLQLAIQSGHTEPIRLLLEDGADIQNVDPFDMRYCVMEAARMGHLEIIHLLFENGANVGEVSEGWSPLLCAVKAGHTDVVKFILYNNANLLTETFDLGETVLRLATSLELVCYLVERGADIHSRDDLGITPLHNAARNGHSDIVGYLLNQGADIDSLDNCGRSALFHAVDGGHATAAKLLIERGCDLKPSDDVEAFYGSLLNKAAAAGLTDVLQLFLYKGLYENLDKVSYGQTPLSAAAMAAWEIRYSHFSPGTRS